MSEIDDYSLGHYELFTQYNSPPVNGCNMEFYMGSASFQEMLDIDIKTEMDSVFNDHDMNFSYNELPEMETSTIHSNGDSIWFSSNSNHSNSNLFDFRNEGATRMVNPNSVLPFNATRVLTPTLASSLNTDVDTPSPKRSHLTFSPASSVDLNNIKQESVSVVKKNLSDTLEKTIKEEMEDIELIEAAHQRQKEEEEELTVNQPQQNQQTQTILVQKQSLNIRPKPVHILTAKTLTTKNGLSLLNGHHTIKISSGVNGQHILTTTPNVEVQQQRQITTSHQALAALNRKKKFQDEDVVAFPKPNYSYSCLIAMALKNSRTGSLPVSEIYNFMCEHFPYFKTAPTGWKNSVRHNLSLNKCFEKIEKPAVTGSQRKGCLWAMHPDKISKMDEEVQKWSRKDPSAIRRAMVYPENLEALERGELKYGCESYGDSSGSGASDSEVENELEDEQNVTIQEDLIELQEDEEEDTKGNVDVETDIDALIMEIAHAQQELFHTNGKRMRLSNDLYQPITQANIIGGRRKTPLIMRNNSNTSFIEIIGE